MQCNDDVVILIGSDEKINLGYEIGSFENNFIILKKKKKEKKWKKYRSDVILNIDNLAWQHILASDQQNINTSRIALFSIILNIL